MSLAEQRGDAPESFKVVGIGTSAGGLESLGQLFDALPTDPGMAFVVVQHLSPDFPSMMDELLSRHCRMPICMAQHDVRVEPNHVYLLPPGTAMIIRDRRLLLTGKERGVPRSLPIDLFLRSLASDCGPDAIAVILSGGTDGSRGIRAVKDAGGTVIVESPETARFDGNAMRSSDAGPSIDLSADAENGTVDARSDGPGHGSEFVVRLPRQARAILPQPAVDRLPPTGNGTRRVVLAEDQPDSREMMRMLLEQLGHVVLEAGDGLSALSAIECHHPDVALVDIGLPKLNGYDVARRLRGNPQFDDVLLVALTGYGTADDVEAARAAGFDEHVTKPSDFDRLTRLITLRREAVHPQM